MKLCLRHLGLFPALFLAACGGSSPEPTGSGSQDISDDQSGLDVQVLQIWTPGRVFPAPPGGWFGPTPADVTVDGAHCPKAASPDGFGSYVDCGDALAKGAPLLDPVLFEVWPGNNQLDPDFCNRVEVRVVVRDASSAQPTFAGVGFYTNKGSAFTAKDQLQSVGHVTLKNGDPATVYRFTGISTCVSSRDSTSGNEFQVFQFKPYAAFDVGSGAGARRYRVWEAVPGNHAIGRSWPDETPVVDSTGFDRQGDLLR